ncbi:hypothetical protein D778_00317 [Xanthomarina gelatinilytica]|uniref:Uncharacterized protein n=1 Tax=Xanthomarina gelatinilytica TaxID=1137281 RepID=M7MFE2_9FLAO|nr:hypothetical protein D778_00317 [Xanthomarina gelatinilytica]
MDRTNVHFFKKISRLNEVLVGKLPYENNATKKTLKELGVFS